MPATPEATALPADAVRPPEEIPIGQGSNADCQNAQIVAEAGLSAPPAKLVQTAEARLQKQEAMAKQQEAGAALVAVAPTPSARDGAVPAEIDGDVLPEGNPPTSGPNNDDGRQLSDGTAGLRGSLGLSGSAGLLTTGTGASAGVPASSTTAGEGAEVGVVRRLSRVAVAGMVLQDKQQQLGADIAAEMALHGIEVHVWQPPELACLSCSPKRCTCAGCPPASPGEFSKRKVSEALARAEAWMVSGPQRDTDAQAQEAWGTDQSEPEPEEAGNPSTSGLVAEPRFLEADLLVTGYDSPAELVHGCDLIIENLADLLEVKREFFGSITSTVGDGTFMTSTTSTAKFNLSDITGAVTTAGCGTVHGVRFLLGKAGSSA